MSNSPELLDRNEKPRSDLRLISRALREGWPIPAEMRSQLTKRMSEIVETRSVLVPDANGVLQDREDVASNHAIAAARVLVAADAVNQTDYWNSDKNSRIDEGRATENIGRAITLTVVGALNSGDSLVEPNCNGSS